MKNIQTLKCRVNLLVCLLLASCGGSGDRIDANGVVIEAISVDSSAVQAAAAPTTGKSDVTERPSGLLGYVKDTSPTRLVVFCHGLGHSVEEAWAAHVQRTVRADTAVVTTNYRDNFKFPILRGAHDTIAATQLAIARFPSIKTVYLLGVSMGGDVSGTAIAESAAISPNGKSRYDYWVDVEGFTNMVEGYGEAKVALPAVATDMEEETGGTPVTQPQAYQRRSPALRPQDMAAGGLKAVAMVHAVNDGLVVHNQAREMALGLIASRISTQFFLVLRKKADQTAGTTATAFLAAIAGIDDPNGALNLAGHGFEGDPNHPVIRTGFEQLNKMLDGTYNASLPYSESVVDDGG